MTNESDITKNDDFWHIEDVLVEAIFNMTHEELAAAEKEDHAEENALARLHAAAPDMAASLWALVHMFHQRCHRHETFSAEEHQIVEAAHAVLIKAGVQLQ